MRKTFKNSSSVARVEPDNEKICTGRDLARALAKTSLADDEAAAWFGDLKIAHKTLNVPGGKGRRGYTKII